MKAGRQGRHSRAGVGTLLVVAMVGTSCTAGSTPEPRVGALATPLPTAVTTNYQLGVTTWYAGLVLHLESASATIDETGGVVSVEMRLENPGTELASLTAPILLVTDGRAIEPVRGTVLPDIPAGLSVGTTLQFDLDGRFELQRAAVRIGRTAEHMVIVPLVAGSQQLVTLEPTALTLEGTATAGKLSLTVFGGELRADIPDWGLELGHGAMALTIAYTARYVGDVQAGFAFTGANLGLVLPDGEILASRPDGHSQSALVLPLGASVPNLFARFEIPVPNGGEYGLMVRDGAVEVTIPITIRVVAPTG